MKKGITLAGRYNLQEKLGQGLFGDAYLAYDEGSGLPVAVKSIPECVNHDERALADFRRNFRLLQSLDHPNIAKVHVMGFDAPTQEHFLVREYVAGYSLMEYRLKYPGGCIPVHEALAICRQMAEALDHAHRFILHRDLTANNVMITLTGEVKLLNFCLVPENLAKNIRAENLTMGMDGAGRSHDYMAPEQFSGFPPPGPAADRYALVVIFYELISGRLPFGRQDPEARTRSAGHMKPPPLPELSRRRNKMVARGLGKDASQRFTSAVAFIDALEASRLMIFFYYAERVALLLAGIVLTIGVTWYFLQGGANKQASLPPPPQNETLSPAQKTVDGANAPPQSQPARPLVALRVETRPAGAKVTLNGKVLGTTPLTVERVVSGLYTLSLEKKDFSPVVVETELVENTLVDLGLDALPTQPALANTGQATIHGTEDKPLAAAPETGKKLLATEPEGKVPEAGKKLVVAEPEITTTTPGGPPGVTPEGGSSTAKPAEEPATPPVPPVAALDTMPLATDPVSGMIIPKPRSKNTPNSVQTNALAGDVPPTDAQKTPPIVETPQSDEATKREISGHLAAASAHLRAWRLTSPVGNNALDQYRRVLAMDPNHPKAKGGLRQIAAKLIALASLDIRASRLTQPSGQNALEKITTARELDPENPSIPKILASVIGEYSRLIKRSVRAKHAKQAQKQLLEAAAIFPQDPRIEEIRRRLLPWVVLPSVVQHSAAATDKGAGVATPTQTPELKEQNLGEIQTAKDQQTQGKTARGGLLQPIGNRWKDPLTGMIFVNIPKGCFHMGGRGGDVDEEPAHKVCLDGFRLAAYEVTQKEWKQVMGEANNPAEIGKSDNHPVNSVSWEEVANFIHKLNNMSSNRFRLPTEAEWEYSCQAGRSTPFQTGQRMSAAEANFNEEYDSIEGKKGLFRKSTLPVGAFSPNQFGLFDMHGNVYEWVEDWYVKDYYALSPERNPLARDDSSYFHVLRGGAWYSELGRLRCSYRYRGRADMKNYGNGFRLAVSIQ